MAYHEEVHSCCIDYMPKTIAIIQSNYIPWKGYFDIIQACDEFILFDEAQYTDNDWRNRNRIKTAQGVQWLTIPVRYSGRFGQRIDETEIANPRWHVKHWKALQTAYGRAPHFRTYRDQIEALYQQMEGITRLSEINATFLRALCDLLGITTPITWSTQYRSQGVKADRVLSLCLEAGADVYISGPSARAYMDDDLFARHGVQVVYQDYSGYPEYPQLYPPFEHSVSVLDVIFHMGPDAPRYIRKAQP